MFYKMHYRIMGKLFNAQSYGTSAVNGEQKLTFALITPQSGRHSSRFNHLWLLCYPILW